MSLNPPPGGLRPIDPLDTATAVQNYETPYSTFLGANVAEGWWNTLPGQAIAAFGTMGPGKNISEEDWKAGPHYREGLEYGSYMNESKARAMADTFDENQYRRWLIEQGSTGPVRAATGFAAQIVGNIPDPINFIPIVGPASRAAMVARFGSVGGRALVGAAEGAIGSAVAAPAILTSQRKFGDDVGFADAVIDVAMSAVIGAAFGGGVGVYSKVRGDPLVHSPENIAAAQRALNEAVSDVAQGRPVSIPRSVGEKALRTVRKARVVEPEAAKPLTLDESDAFAQGGAPISARMRQDELDVSLDKLRTGGMKEPSLPRLASWLVRNRGLRDDGGEIVAAAGSTRARPGLINNKSGMTLDEAAERAWEEGFLGEVGPGQVEMAGVEARPTPDALVTALRRDLAGDPVYRRQDRGQLDEYEALTDLGEELSRADVDLNKMTNAQARLALNKFYGGPAETGPLSLDDIERIYATEPQEVAEAQARVGRSATVDEMAAEQGLTVEGDFEERVALDQLRNEGKLTQKEVAEIAAADEIGRRADGYARAYEAAAACLSRN